MGAGPSSGSKLEKDFGVDFPESERFFGLENVSSTVPYKSHSFRACLVEMKKKRLMMFLYEYILII